METTSEAVDAAIKRLEDLGPITPNDSDNVRKEKFDALFALRDAAIADGMELWDADRVDAEVARMRGR